MSTVTPDNSVKNDVAGRPKRTISKPVHYADEEEVRSTRRRKKNSEDSSKPAAQPFPIGLKIRKWFGNEYFEGRVESGPKDDNALDEPVWCVTYTDGDKEEMNWKELKEYRVEETTTTQSRQREEEEERGESDDNNKPYQNQVKDYDMALKDLKYKMGNNEEEVKAALDQMKSPYGLNEAMQLIHEAKKGDEAYVPREKFVIKKGMRVRKNFLGSTYYGTVVEDKGEYCNVDVFGETRKVKHWKVLFDDGDEEDWDFDELLANHAGRPMRQHPINGRPLCFLELFGGCCVVTQEFAERKWRVRSIDNNKSSHATDVVDIMKVRYKHIGMVPDCIWASPPCTTYTLVTCGHHRGNEPGQYEKTPEARLHNRFLLQMFAIMKWAKEKNPHLIVVIENPVGQLQNMPLMKQVEEELKLEKVTVDYCAFGRDDKKPTQLWTNDWKLRKTLSDYRCNKKCPYFGGVHPIGTKQNGHQYNAAAIPDALAEEVAEEVCARFREMRIRKETKEVIPTEEEVEEFDRVLASG